MTKTTGRPPKFKSPEELQKKIDEYFEKGVRTKVKIVGNTTVEIPVPTITGLVLYLGFADRQSMFDYEKKEAFTCTIKKARTFIEREYEELLQTNNVAGAIFALKNMGWRDKQEIEHGATDKLQELLAKGREIGKKYDYPEESKDA